jgi:hypothetical protein
MSRSFLEEANQQTLELAHRRDWHAVWENIDNIFSSDQVDMRVQGISLSTSPGRPGQVDIQTWR